MLYTAKKIAKVLYINSSHPLALYCIHSTDACSKSFKVIYDLVPYFSAGILILFVLYVQFSQYRYILYTVNDRVCLSNVD